MNKAGAIVAGALPGAGPTYFPRMTGNTDAVTVYYDGACPLCLKEIGLLRRLDRHDRLVFEDVSPAGAAPSCSIDRDRLLARFHVRRTDGSMVSGAQAFTEAWSRVPGLSWLRAIGRFGPTRWLLDRLYDAFLTVRPALQRLAG